MSVLTEARHASIANGRSVPFPLQLLSKVRQQTAEQTAAAAARSSGGPCTMRGHIGEESGDVLPLASKRIFERQHVRRLNGEPYLVHIRYGNLMSDGRAVATWSRGMAAHGNVSLHVACVLQLWRSVWLSDS